MGAWIEISLFAKDLLTGLVAPLVGAWIEIVKGSINKSLSFSSHPSWVRGLKLESLRSFDFCNLVAPLVGAWIEIAIIFSPLFK